MTPQTNLEFKLWMCLMFKGEDGSDRYPLPRPPLSQSRTWAVNIHEPLPSGRNNSVNRHISFSVPPIRPEPDDPDTAHAKRRLSLIAKLPELASSCQDLHTEINDASQYIETPAFQETREFWLSLMIVYSRAALETINLQASAEKFEIHRLSSFWTRAWQAVYEQRQSIRMTQEVLEEIRMDYGARTNGAAHSQDLIDGFQIQFFRDKVESLVDHCVSTVKRIRDVNWFAPGEHQRSVRQAQWMECEQLSDTLERMAMRRLVPPSLQKEFEHP
jgi:hypothetical protein